MIVSRILHAGYIFESAGVRIAFDPILETPFSTNCHAFPAVTFEADPHRYDAVFLSHFHDDHCSLTSLAKIARTTPIYLYCLHPELFDFIRQLGFTVRPLELNTSIHVDAFTVTPRLALDPDVDCVLEIEAEDLRILNVVDAWLDPSSVKPGYDLVLWPFQTMRELDVLMPSEAVPAERGLPPEWVEQLKTLNARYVVPSSCQIRFEEWSWYNREFFPITYAQFEKQIANAQRINPGESFELKRELKREPAGKLASEPGETSFIKIGRLPWVLPQGEQNVDYTYEHTQPPQTAEIAKRFPALTREERAKVDQFCEGLDVTLFDHEGQAKGSGSTEAIAYKVYRALEHGEQITSMYLRTEDIDSDELIQKLSQDPLSYQRAQLKKLLP